MKTDRELLELAARAAGYVVDDCGCGKSMRTSGETPRPHRHWNPLRDSGDAMRLSVDLGLHVEQYGIVRAYKRVRGSFWVHGREPAGDDRLAATRIAIVRAAAAIGEDMQ
jgi:hypothetical protein